MIDHSWAKIGCSGRTIWVSRDAYKVDGVRRRFTANEARDMADQLGGRLPTPRELDARFAAAALHNLPKPGNPVTRTDAQHSADVDATITIDGYQWIVGNVGKHWVDYRADDIERLTPFVRMKPGREAEYGWHADKHTKPLMPAPVYPSETDPDLWVIQRPWDSSHGADYSDYAMTGVFVRDDAPASWWEIDADGRVVCISSVGSIPPPPDTLPSPPSSDVGAEPTHGQRCVDWMLEQMAAGVREDPDGSNNGPEIGAWLGACVRDGQPGIGNYLKRRGANWCAAAACAADTATRRETDPPAAHKTRCSGLEIEIDAKGAGCYKPVSAVLSGLWAPEPGDIVNMQRGKPGSWKRHVTRFVRWDDPDVAKRCPHPDDYLWTIGGNEQNRFRLTKRRLGSVLCFVAMVDARPAGEPIAVANVSLPHPDQLEWDGDNALA